MVVMAMRNGDGVDFLVPDLTVQGQTLTSLALGMYPRVHQELVAIHLDKPGAGPDVRIRIEIGNSHVWNSTGGRNLMEKRSGLCPEEAEKVGRMS